MLVLLNLADRLFHLTVKTSGGQLKLHCPPGIGKRVLSFQLCPLFLCSQEECGGGEQNVEPVGGAHTPYDPTLHAHSKPPFSFSCLIFMAIEASPRKALPVKDIYGWILGRFPYFQGAPSGWKNSVRHNLSLSKCFRKVDKEKGQVRHLPANRQVPEFDYFFPKLCFTLYSLVMLMGVL